MMQMVLADKKEIYVRWELLSKTHDQTLIEVSQLNEATTRSKCVCQVSPEIEHEKQPSSRYL